MVELAQRYCTQSPSLDQLKLKSNLINQLLSIIHVYLQTPKACCGSNFYQFSWHVALRHFWPLGLWNRAGGAGRKRRARAREKGRPPPKACAVAIPDVQCDLCCTAFKMQHVSVQESVLVAFSPKLECLATATRDGRLKAFDTGTGTPILVEPCISGGTLSMSSSFINDFSTLLRSSLKSS